MSPTTATSFETTPSNVKHIVSESKFHDETLCQLLDAARLNLIGPDAKRALQRAARARVIELRDMRANGEVSAERHLTVMLMAAGRRESAHAIFRTQDSAEEGPKARREKKELVER
jgi:hypothetical protein